MVLNQVRDEAASVSPANPPADRIPALETVPSSRANASLRNSYTPKYATDLEERQIPKTNKSRVCRIVAYAIKVINVH